jgi:hypothetical protein
VQKNSSNLQISAGYYCDFRNGWIIWRR